MPQSKFDETKVALGRLKYVTDWYDEHHSFGTNAVDAYKVLKAYVDKPRHVVGVSALITSGTGALLLGKRNRDIQGGGLYSTPGGKVELGESIEEATIREVKEECGIDISDVYIENLGFKQHHRFGDHSVIFYMYVRLGPELFNRIKNMELDKCEGWEWFCLNNVPDANCMTEPEEFIHELSIREEPVEY